MKYVFTLIHLLLIALAVFLGVRAMYIGLKSPEPIVHEPVERQDATRAIPEETPLALFSEKLRNTVVQRNLFQVDNGSARAPEPRPLMETEPVETLEKTSLNVKLWGTVTGTDSGTWAVIEDNTTRKQALYRPGDALQGALIKTVLRQRVILSLAGKDQVLEMAEQRSSQPPLQAFQPGSLEPAAAPSAFEPESVVLERSAIVESTSDINSLMKQVRVRPHFSQGKPDGLLVYGIQPDSLFQQMGLRNGDIISGIDGKEIQSVDDALNLYKNLKDASDVSLQIKRRGSTKEITYHVQQ